MKRFEQIIRFLCLLSFLCISGETMGQFDARFSQYWAVPTYYHAGSVGQGDKLNIQAAYGMQLMGFERAPRVMFFGVDFPFTLFYKKHGAGIFFFNEGIGLFRNQKVGLQYAYQWKLKRSHLGIGVQLGMLNVSFDPTGVNLGDEAEDPAFPDTKEQGIGMDLGVSLAYTHPSGYAALSAQHLTVPSIEIGEKSNVKVNPIFYLEGGYNIRTRNPLIYIQPSVQMQTDFYAFRMDATARLFYTWRGKKFSAAVGYSPSTSLTFGLGMQVRSVTVGYAYELFTSKIGVSSGSHDLVVSYAIDMNVFKKSRSLHKSVRLL